jgi:methionyl-tRNA formyltransferase
MTTYVIASQRPWNASLADELAKETGHTFNLIQHKDELTLEKLDALSPRKIFVPHWSDIIPQEIIENYDCVIFHMTDLPYGRGGSPLQNLITEGKTETKISALKATSELDAGPIYLKHPLSLDGRAEDIFYRASDIIKIMIKDIVRTNPTPVEQSGSPTLFKRRKPQESDIAHLDQLSKIYDHIRMLDAPGYPHAYIETESMKLEFTNAQLNGNNVTANVTITKKVSPSNENDSMDTSGIHS